MVNQQANSHRYRGHAFMRSFYFLKWYAWRLQEIAKLYYEEEERNEIRRLEEREYCDEYGNRR